MSFTAVQSSHGITLSWGTTNIGVTSMQYSRSAAAEIDTTGFTNTINQDPDNTDRKYIVRSVDYAVVDPGELSCEFYGPGGFNENFLGIKRVLSLTGLTTGPSTQAVLTQISTQLAVGDLIKGSCTFRLSDQ